VHFESNNLLVWDILEFLLIRAFSQPFCIIRIASSMDNMEISGTDSISDVGTATMVA